MKFSTAGMLYCYGTCGDDWLDKEYGCQKADADAFCKLKFCEEDDCVLEHAHTIFTCLARYAVSIADITIERTRLKKKKTIKLEMK